jgi:hypothetical protein
VKPNAEGRIDVDFLVFDAFQPGRTHFNQSDAISN